MIYTRSLQALTVVLTSSYIVLAQYVTNDPAGGCPAAYSYAPVDAVIGSYPVVWHQPASIVPNDAAALALWNSISAGVPNIPIKGVNGTVTMANYSSSDPDCWWTYDQCVTPKLAGLNPDVAKVPEPKTLGYGFDDGPQCGHDAFYDYLTSENQKATMFYIGSNVFNWPIQAQRAASDGHEICVHTWSHVAMTGVSSEDAFAELYYAREAIKLVTGVTPLCWRPPLGDVDDRIRYIAQKLNLTTIIWQTDTFDWNEGVGGITDAQVDANYQAVIDSANNGTYDSTGVIMLAHELSNYTMSKAITYYPQLKSAFEFIVPVNVALNRTQPYVETNITGLTFAQYVDARGASVTGGGSSNTASQVGATQKSSSGTATNTAGAISTSTSTKDNGAAGLTVRAAGILLAFIASSFLCL